jgi:DNA-binding LytR/AlgR family response regulator
MKAIIIDDEPHAIEVIRRYAEQVEGLILCGVFRSGLKALTFLQSEEVDLIFLDINMPGINGIDFLKSLSRKPDVIFTTAYSEYAVKSYELNAVDYLLKPVSFDRFLKAINKVTDKGYRSARDASEHAIILKSGTITHKVNLDDILFIKKESNYLEFHTVSKKILVRGNMNDIFSLVPGKYFRRVHKSYVVGIRNVTAVSADFVEVKNHKVPIGESYSGEAHSILD